MSYATSTIIPPFPLLYWRPWNTNSNFSDNYLDYLKDISLAKYSANTVGEYIKQASKEQVNAINRVCTSMGFVVDQLGQVNQNISLINQNLKMQHELQQINNVLLQDISELLRIPESEKQRQHHIELGLKFLSNTINDEDLFLDALEEFIAAENLMKQDYFVLHRIGMIYLFAKSLVDPLKALDYFKRAAKYAIVESDPKSARLINLLVSSNKSNNFINSDQLVSSDNILKLAGDSYEKASFAAYVLGDFKEAVDLGEKVKKYLPTAENLFLLAKYQIRNNQIENGIANLEEAININPLLANTCFSDLDLINEIKVLQLLEQKNEIICKNINDLIQYLKTNSSEEDETLIKVLIDALNADYEFKFNKFNEINLITENNKLITDEIDKLINQLANKSNSSDQTLLFINKLKDIKSKGYEIKNKTYNYIKEEILKDDSINLEILKIIDQLSTSNKFYFRLSELLINKYIIELKNTFQLDLIKKENEFSRIKNEIEKNGLFKIGDIFDGGIIFHIDESGQHGLIVTKNDVGIYQLQEETILGTIKKDLKSICKKLKIEGYNDWYLPNINELKLLFDQKSKIDGIFEDFYWSSTPDGAFSYFLIYLGNKGNGESLYGNYYTKYRVRAIRKF